MVFDNGQLSRLFHEAAGASMQTAHSLEEALSAVDENCLLVLINRIFDRTGEQGLALVQQLQEHHPQTPTMLLSNYADAQEAAEAAGALPGFGKSQLGDSGVAQRLKALLNPQESPDE